MAWKAAAGAVTALGLAAFSTKPEAPPAALAWAYPKASDHPSPDIGKGPFQAPGSTRTLTLKELTESETPFDWFPDRHPRAPDVVAAGRAGVMACGVCHGITGEGDLGAPNLAGLRADYIKREVHAFARGDRRSSEAGGRPAVTEMTHVAEKVSAADLAEAARYFASLPRPKLIRVVEGETAPAVKPHQYGWMTPVAGAPPEAIAGRIVELPEDVVRTAISDPYAQRIVYAPVGAVARGRRLVRNGPAGGQPCAACHGEGLHGTAIAPPLAGRSPSYLARQMWDLRSGARGGPTVALMQAPVRALRTEDVTPVAAYLASLKP